MVVILGPNTLEQLRALPRNRHQLVIAVPHADEDILLDDVIEQVKRFGELIIARTLPDAFELL
jgi:hypothetical protein